MDRHFAFAHDGDAITGIRFNVRASTPAEAIAYARAEARRLGKDFVFVETDSGAEIYEGDA